MNAHDLVLNIAVNMGRLSRWSMEGRSVRIKQFLDETDQYLNKLNQVEVNEKFKPTQGQTGLKILKSRDPKPVAF